MCTVHATSVSTRMLNNFSLEDILRENIFHLLLMINYYYRFAHFQMNGGQCDLPIDIYINNIICTFV